MARLLLLLSACGDDAVAPRAADAGARDDLGQAPPDGGDPAIDLAARPSDLRTEDASLVAARPYGIHVPIGYDKTKAAPLVLLLHGYSASGALQEAYFKLTPLSDQKTFLYAYPDGLVDKIGNHYWNATDACCDLFGSKVDDVAYLNAVIDDIESKFQVDPRRIFLVGHSNGAFMAHRLACDSSSRIAGIVALAGATWKDQAKCQPTEPVAILDVHGDLDAVISYQGGTNSGAAYPSEHETVADWALHDHCGGALMKVGAPLDLDGVLQGAETTVEGYAGCKDGDVELWTIHGGSHLPSLTGNWGPSIWGFLSAHPKP